MYDDDVTLADCYEPTEEEAAYERATEILLDVEFGTSVLEFDEELLDFAEPYCANQAIDFDEVFSPDTGDPLHGELLDVVCVAFVEHLEDLVQEFEGEREASSLYEELCWMNRCEIGSQLR